MSQPQPKIIDFVHDDVQSAESGGAKLSVPMPVVYFVSGALTAAILIYIYQSTQRRPGYVF